MNRLAIRFLILLLCISVLAACESGAVVTNDSQAQPTLTLAPSLEAAGSPVFFDDFNYQDSTDPELQAHGWEVRTAAGGPGSPEASWPQENVAFIPDPDHAGNSLVQLTATTDGTPANTQEAELDQQRKFYEGTYASRVRFSNDPVFGPDGDTIVQTFYTITPLNYDNDPDYGEIDYEYLPNGGWDTKESTFFLTTWESYIPDPWTMDHSQSKIAEDFSGWHILVVQVMDGEVKYFVDGELVATHGDKYYPETPMAISYNLWFSPEGFSLTDEPRQYQQQIDWLYYVSDEIIAPDQVQSVVDGYRASKAAHIDTVPEWTAPAVVIVPSPTPIPAGPRPFEADIHEVTDITIDGTLLDWSGEPTFVLQEQAQVVYPEGGTSWHGPDDFSAKAWVGWAEDGLYLAIEVTDNVIYQAWTDANIWQGDYVELQLDTEFMKDYDDPLSNADDFQFGFTPGDFEENSAQLYMWQGSLAAEELAAIKQAQTRTETGYVLEVFIPKELLAGIDFSVGGMFGMNINPSDTDDATLPQKLMMSTSAIRERTNPTTFGQITLQP